MIDFKFNWDPRLELGIAHIDTQHQELFKIGRSIEQWLLIQCVGATSEDLLNILYELRDFVTYHFFTEEEYMRSIAYPDLEAHHKDHQSFKKYINKIDYEALCASPQKELIKLRDKLVDWIFNHQVQYDRQFAAFALLHKED